MSDSHTEIGVSNNRRIAKNTIMLYVRMLVMMLVSLVTSRVYLKTLGETDFGIFNIVGGLVLSFAFISSTMQIATQRFLNYVMAKEDEYSVKKVFNVSLLIYFLISAIILVIAETIGLWFLNSKMNIPPERLIAANWVYQFSVLGFVFQMIRIPYNATIIAYEEMSFYAYFSIFEAILKLGTAFFVVFFGFDKLVVISSLTAIVYLVVFIGYKVYCNKKYDITHFKWIWDKKIIVEMSKYSGWSLYGAGCIMSSNQGVDLVVNYFWGVTVNAALGIASQLSHAINMLVSNFQIAYNPQLVKLYAQDKFSEFNLLIRRAAKFSFFLLLYAFIPFFLCSSDILHLWLGVYPSYTNDFVRLMLIYVLLDSLQAPLWLSALASGKIKKYQIVTGTIILMNIPIVFLLMKFGLPPQFAWGCRILISVILFIARVWYLKSHMGFQFRLFLQNTVFRCFFVLAVSLILPYMVYYYTNDGIVQILFVLLVNLFSVTISVFFFGLTSAERVVIGSYIRKITKR